MIAGFVSGVVSAVCVLLFFTYFKLKQRGRSWSIPVFVSMSVLQANLKAVNEPRSRLGLELFSVHYLEQPLFIMAGPYIIMMGNSIFHGGLSRGEVEEFLLGSAMAYQYINTARNKARV